MRILILSQYFYPEPFRINEIAKSLSLLGNEVIVVTGKPNYPEGFLYPGYTACGVSEEVYGKVRVLRVPLYPRGRKNTIRLFVNYLSFIISALLFAPLKLRLSGIDLILVYGLSPVLQSIPAFLLKKIKKAPLILYLQDLWPESLEATGYIKNKIIIHFVRLIVSYIYKNCDLILISSRPFSEQIIKLSPKSKIAYLPNSVDSSFLDSDTGIKPVLAELNTGFAVVFAGNVGSAQAMHVVVEAAELLAEIKDIRFVIIGDGSELEWMKCAIKEKKLSNLYLVGRYPVNAMPHLLSKASILLVTLTDRKIFAQTVPNKIQAYMAVGRPIIAALNGEGARLVLDANAGLAVPAEDPESLAKAIIEIYHMPLENRILMGVNAQNYFKNNFNHEQLMAQLIGHMQTLTRK